MPLYSWQRPPDVDVLQKNDPWRLQRGKRFVDRPPPHPTGPNVSEARRPPLPPQDEPS